MRSAEGAVSAGAAGRLGRACPQTLHAEQGVGMAQQC